MVIAVEAGLKAGTEIGILGTPTVFVNGWRYANAPRDSLLVELIQKLLAGKNPAEQHPHN